MSEQTVLSEKVIAVMAYGRGGSGLWSSLFDFHPNVLMLPDCIIMDFYSFWDQHGHLKYGKITERFISHYSIVFDARESNLSHFDRFSLGEHLGFCNMGPNRNEILTVDRDVFKRALGRILDWNSPGIRKVFFQAVHSAYAEALGRKVQDPVIVFGLHVTNPLNAQRLLDDFPQSIFLQTIREPVHGMAAWFRHFCSTEARINPDLFSRALAMAFDTAHPIPAEYERRWFALRLEDVHNSPEETVRRVSSFLGLKWYPVLLESTFNGKKWWNEKKSIQVNGFNRDIIHQPLDEFLSALDRWRLGIALAARAKAWGYRKGLPRLHEKVLCLIALTLPFRMERICRKSARQLVAESSPQEAISGGHNVLSGSSFGRSLSARTALKRLLLALLQRRLYLSILGRVGCHSGLIFMREYIAARKKLIRECFAPPTRNEATVISASTDPLPDLSGKELLRLGGSDTGFVRQANEMLEQANGLLERGDHEKAHRTLDQAIRYAPNIVALHAAQARVCEGMGLICKANYHRNRAGMASLAPRPE